PAALVDEEPQDLPAARPPELDVDQLEPLLCGERSRDLAHLVEDFVFPSHCNPENKKVGHCGPTFGYGSENVRPEVTDRPMIVKQRRRRPCSSRQRCR